MKQLLVDSMLCFSFDRTVTDNCLFLILILDCINSDLCTFTYFEKTCTRLKKILPPDFNRDAN